MNKLFRSVISFAFGVWFLFPGFSSSFSNAQTKENDPLGTTVIGSALTDSTRKAAIAGTKAVQETGSLLQTSIGLSYTSCGGNNG